MNPFDTELECICLLKQMCEQSTSNQDMLDNLKLLRTQQETTMYMLHHALKQLEHDTERTNKKIRELDSVITNRNRSSDSYYRVIQQKEENR